MAGSRRFPFKKILLILLAGLVVFVAILMFHTFRFSSKQIESDPISRIKVPADAVDHFSQALRFKTVSTEDPTSFDSTEFRGFAAFLASTYPLADSLLNKKTFNEFSFLYQWQGSNPALKPIMLIAHLDVVPVIDQNRSDWHHDPFGGEVIQDTVWGRGAIDDKNVVIAVMETVEMLLEEDFEPARGINIAVVHDEEIGGVKGAKAIAAHLESKGEKAAFILDEGGVVSQGLIPGIESDLALIGVAEKGFLSLKMEAKIEGGHSSIPSRETAIDVLAKAVSTLKENPFPASISPPIEGFIDYVGPELPFFKKMVFANSSLFESIIIGIYEEKASGNALVRTTTAPTLFHAGVKDNVVPQVASATVNFRILPGESVESVEAHVRKTINDDRIILTQGTFRSEPSPVSSTEAAGFQRLQKTMSQVYPGMMVSPYLMVGATDSRHFRAVSEHIYRFSPIRITPDNIKSFHGLNECLSVAEFEQSIRFYYQLIKGGDAEN